MNQSSISSVAMKAKQIRKEFKSARIKASVTSSNGILESAIRVCVFTGSVPLATRIAEKQKQVDRCERTGETLGGGNTFVTVTVDSSLIDSVCLPIASAVAEALKQALSEDAQKIHKIEGTIYGLSWDIEMRRGHVWNKHSVGQFQDVRSATRVIARAMLEEGFVVETKIDAKNKGQNVEFF